MEELITVNKNFSGFEDDLMFTKMRVFQRGDLVTRCESEKCITNGDQKKT